MGEVPMEFNSFFKFWKNFILIWNKSVFFLKFIFKLFFKSPECIAKGTDLIQLCKFVFSQNIIKKCDFYPHRRKYGVICWGEKRYCKKKIYYLNHVHFKNWFTSKLFFCIFFFSLIVFLFNNLTIMEHNENFFKLRIEGLIFELIIFMMYKLI